MCAKSEIGKTLYYLKKASRWTSGTGAELPKEYKKFWWEWKLRKPVAVHYVKDNASWRRNEETGITVPVQNRPIPVIYPKEHNHGIWGGEGVVQGFEKRTRCRHRVPHFWVPVLMKSVVYSEVLNKYMRTIITDRTIMLIHENYGFDHYLLKTPACDLKSELALRLKREILLALADKTLYPDDPIKQEEIYNKYQQYLTAYTRKEIEWYGLTFKEACIKWSLQKAQLNKVEPLKQKYRLDLIKSLRKHKIRESMQTTVLKSKSSWLSMLNPFAKTSKAQ